MSIRRVIISFYHKQSIVLIWATNYLFRKWVLKWVRHQPVNYSQKLTGLWLKKILYSVTHLMMLVSLQDMPGNFFFAIYARFWILQLYLNLIKHECFILFIQNRIKYCYSIFLLMFSFKWINFVTIITMAIVYQLCPRSPGGCAWSWCCGCVLWWGRSGLRGWCWHSLVWSQKLSRVRCRARWRWDCFTVKP